MVCSNILNCVIIFVAMKLYRVCVTPYFLLESETHD